MTDLQERGDLWKWDLYKKTWSNIKTKLNPGPLHSHSCCKLPSTMIIFGGERNGEVCNDLWKFNFGMSYTFRLCYSLPTFAFQTLNHGKKFQYQDPNLNHVQKAVPSSFPS